MPASEAGKFIWRREARALSLGLIGSGDWGGVICLTGATGDPGATGKGIVSITQEYYQSDSMLVLEGGSWGESVPAWSNGKYTWTRTRTNFSDSTSATTDPVCVTGPPGVNGNPGQLGIYADGDTLIVKGFAEDGTLTASQGYIYVGDSRITVPAYSQQLTGEGQGYVVWDGTSVQFTKMQLQSSSIKWLFYNGDTEFYPSLIIGKFEKDGSDIFNEIILEPLSVDQYNKSHFMEILAEHDWNELESWADALGVQQVFRSIAAWQIFTDELIANTGFIDKLGTKEITIKENGHITSDDFTEEDGVPTSGFRLDTYDYEDPDTHVVSKKGRLRAYDSIISSSTIFGTILHPSLQTKEKISSDEQVFFSDKTAWDGEDLYNSLTNISVGNTLKSLAGTNGGKTIIKAARLSSSGSIDISSGSAAIDPLFVDEFYIPQYAGRLYVEIGTQSSFLESSNVAAYKNGVLFLKQSTTGWNTRLFKNSTTISVEPGDRIHFTRNGGTQAWYYYEVMTNIFPTSGTFIGYDDGSYSYFRTDGYYEDALTVPNYFEYSSYLNYASILGFLSGIDDKPSGIYLRTNSDSQSQYFSKFTYDTFTDEAIIAVMRTPDGLRVYHSTGYVFFKFPSETDGWYVASGQYTLLGQITSIETKNIIPMQDEVDSGTYKVGDVLKPFAEGHFTGLYADTFTQDGKPAYACRAWVNFNGTGTVSIRASENVSTVTDNGTGTYTINFENPMSHANYAYVFGTQWNTGPFIVGRNTVSVPTVNSFRISVGRTTSGDNVDVDRISVAIFC
jgi:hypothetical protein